MNIKDFIGSRQERVNSKLLQLLPSPIHQPTSLHDAMHYSVLNGGKRMRPLLLYATGEAFGLETELLDYPACAVELIHAYSLVHDDLPAMDDDDMRRGKPTCHKAYDEATAILVGDALQTLAFHCLATNTSFDDSVRLTMISSLSQAAGSLGMVGGQALDLGATGKELNSAALEQIHHLKTGALICAAIKLGLLAANVTDSNIANALMEFGKYIGLCFQVQDDILNHEGKTLILGKRTGTDAAKKKATYTTIENINNAKEKLQLFYEKSLQALANFDCSMDTLRALANYIVKRDH